MLSFSQPVVANWSARRVIGLRVEPKAVVAPTDSTSGSAAGEPIVSTGPASPPATTTVTSRRSATSLNRRTASSEVTSGNGLAPNDSLSTFTRSLVTA